MKTCIVVSGNTGIWVVDPEHHRTLRIRSKLEKNPILDLYVDSSGIYHAEEKARIEENGFLLKRQFRIPYVSVFNSLSPIESLFTVSSLLNRQRDFKDKPLPALEFKFQKENGSLLYTLHEQRGVVMEKCPGTSYQSEDVTLQGGKLFFRGQAIGEFDEPLVKAYEMHGQDLVREVSRRNRFLYDANHQFLNGLLDKDYTDKAIRCAIG